MVPRYISSQAAVMTDRAPTRTAGPSVVRHGVSVRRRFPSRLVLGIAFGVVATFAVFVLCLPLWALSRRDWGPSDVASAIQASTSVFGAIVGGVALVAAVLAYADAQQRPVLRLAVRNSMSAVSFQLQNVGSLSATNPRIVVRCRNHPYVRPEGVGVGRGEHSVQWRLEEHLTGGLGFRKLTWVPRNTSRVIHPDLTLATPPLDFGSAAQSRGTKDAIDMDLELDVTWTADRTSVSSERLTLRLPTARDESYY
jgi:hypothetical protein